jgi:starch synthase
MSAEAHDSAVVDMPALPPAASTPTVVAVEAPVVIEMPAAPAPAAPAGFDPLAAIEARIAAAPKFVLAELPTVVVREGVEFQGVSSLETAIAGVPPPPSKPVVARPATAHDKASASPVDVVGTIAPLADVAVAAPLAPPADVAAPLAPPADVAVPLAPPVDAAGTIAPRATSDAQPGERTFDIVMIASEAVGFAKTGGLADVAGALPVALGKLGHRVTIVLPRYRGIAISGKPVVDRLTVQLGGEAHTVSIYERELGANARAWLVDEPALFDRDGGLYNVDGHDYPDNPRRFALLTRAALEGARAAGLTPDVVHSHDWQGGLAPLYLKTRFAHDPVLGGVPSVFTIHNMAYQGRCDPSWIPQLDLGWDLFRPEALEFWHQVSLLKAGVVFADKVTTVSPRYAQEILTPEFGEGFEGVLAGRRGDLVGIVNGIDDDVWNPATDPKIPQPYSADDLSGKQAAKRALLQAYGLPSHDDALAVPVIGMVSRMVDQKGLDLIQQIAADLPHLGARIVILGTGEPRYEEMWRALTAAYPDRISAKVGFDEDLSHLLEAGADLFLMPSRFEPCGLNQMYSQRYGTLPLVRATGGLDDTVENYDPYRESGTGFKFWEASGLALLNTLRWALQVYAAPEVWRRLQRDAMQRDFSWTRSARDYAALYGQLVPAQKAKRA